MCDELLEECRGNPKAFAEKIVGIPMHAKQVDLVLLNKDKNCVHTGHRFGKTIGIAFKHLYYCIYKIGLPLDDEWYSQPYKTINTSFEYNMAQKVYDIITQWFVKRSPYLKEGGPLVKRYSLKDKRVEFQLGSEFHFSSLEENGKHVEGEAYRYLSVDEAGQEKNLGAIWENTLKWRLVGSSGFADFVGTPKPWSDPFFEELSLLAISDPKIGHFEGSTYDNPFLPKDDLAKIEEDVKDYPHMKDMYLLGKFVPFAGRLLSAFQIQNAIDDNLPIGPGINRLSFGTVPRQVNRAYASFWDLAFTTDWTVGITLDVTEIPYRQVNYTRVNRSNISSWAGIFDLMKREVKAYGLKGVYYDASGPHGSIIQQTLKDLGIPGKPIWITAPSNNTKLNSGKVGKNELINRLEMAFCYKQPIYDEAGVLMGGDEDDWGLVRIPRIKQEITELSLYNRDDKKLTTDSVIALAGAILVAKKAASEATYYMRDRGPSLNLSPYMIGNPAFSKG